MFAATIFVLFIIVAFSLGILTPVLATRLGASVHGAPSRLMRLTRAIKRKSGYIAAFGAGVALTLFVFVPLNPYAVARWVGTYDAAIVGRHILQDETILKTGFIPEQTRNDFFPVAN